MKKLSLIFVIIFSLLLSFTSCKVNWFGEQTDAPWYTVAIPLAVIAIAILIIGKVTFSKKEYICPECKTVFFVKWWKALFALHYNSDRVLKCPNCGRRGFCKVYKDE